MEKPRAPISETEFLASLTEESVRELGYSSLEVYLLEHQLGKLAGLWRRTKDQAVVQQYHDLFNKLVELGWDPNLLDLESALPRELMPAYEPKNR